MNYIDIVLGILIGYGAYKGLKNGIFVEIASIIALIVGIYGAIHFSYIAGEFLQKNMQWNERYINIAAFILTFLIIVIIVRLAGKFLTKVADSAMLGSVNKIAGGLFGGLKMIVIIGAILIFFNRINSVLGIVKEETLEDSVLYKPVQEIGTFVFNAVLKGKDSENEGKDSENEESS